MNVLSVENISKTLKDAPLFEHVTFGLEQGQRLGLIGHNGAGKSTFLRLLAGQMTPDTGTIACSRDQELLVLDQHVSWEGDITVRQFLFQGAGTRIQRYLDYTKTLEALRHEGSSPILERRLAELTEQMNDDGTWDLENDYASYLSELALGDDIQDKHMDELSGGMQKKAAIARVLCAKPTMLLLDEPTNHLDIPTIEWLERTLCASRMTIIVVTHDRYFLNHVCSAILELEGGVMYLHPGSFSSYMERKAQRLEAMQKEQERLNVILRRELEWLKRGPQARTGKDSGRKQRIRQMLDSQHAVGRDAQASFVSTARRMGKKILEVQAISKGYGDGDVVHDFTYSFTKGERIGIIGQNGTGKSTLLDMLTGHLQPDSGTIDTGVNTVFGYYDQLGRDLHSDKGVLEYMQDISERITVAPGYEVTAARFLEIFGFPSSFHRLPISILSGGERRRLYLISRLIVNPNFLVLDEPTNDLDLETMQRLEQYVLDFQGCVLVVSHDRAFLDCTCDQLFILDGTGTVSSYMGSFSDYRQDYEDEDKLGTSSVLTRKKIQESAPAPKKEAPAPKKGLTYKENKELEALTAEIEEMEAERSDLELSFGSAETTAAGTLAERSRRYEQLDGLLAQRYERWEELAQKA